MLLFAGHGAQRQAMVYELAAGLLQTQQLKQTMRRAATSSNCEVRR
jgi:ribosomal protein L17